MVIRAALHARENFPLAILLQFPSENWDFKSIDGLIVGVYYPSYKMRTYKRPDDWIGLTFGRLTIKSIIGKQGPKNRLVCEAVCVCGNTCQCTVTALSSGSRLSCGCLKREKLSLPTALRGKSEGARMREDDNLEAKREIQKRWVKKNPEKVSEIAARFRAAHPDLVRAKKAAYYQREKKKIIAKYKKRFKTDVAFRIMETLRSRLRKLVRQTGVKKVDSTLKIAGCSLEFLQAHLKSLFTEGMTWDLLLKGKIHIDHKKPCASFDLKNPEHQRECFGWQNLQPLWGPDNYAKGSKLDWKPTRPKSASDPSE